MGSLLSGILGGGSSPGQEQQAAALKASRADIQRLRPELMQAKLNALGNMTSAYQGSNNALETLWGAPQQGGPSPLLGKIGGSPTRMLGHDMPQEAPRPQQAPSQQPFQGGSLLDPLGIFGRR